VSVTYLTTEQLATRIHYSRPFGGRKLLFIWEAIERDITNFSLGRSPIIPMARGGVAHG